jgi:hypothetical protein
MVAQGATLIVVRDRLFSLQQPLALRHRQV